MEQIGKPDATITLPMNMFLELTHSAQLAEFTRDYLKAKSTEYGNIDANPMRILYGLAPIVWKPDKTEEA